MFTGLLPSQHGAHFQTMAYTGSAPTIAQILARVGYHTELITRNSLFDGTLPGTVRGFRVNSRILGDFDQGAIPLALVMALAKPRLRRLMRQSGFFHVLQRSERDFVTTLMRMGMPADRRVLCHAIDRMGKLTRSGKPWFMFLNLYDVHAPYSPSETSPLRSCRSIAGVIENLRLPFVLPRVSSHSYLRAGFRLAESSRRMLLSRYHKAIELMDRKLKQFYDEVQCSGLLDNTVMIVTSDHGEAFGDHGLYFHDASVYNTHLHVPLWIREPAARAAERRDVVSTRDLFGVLVALGVRGRTEETMLDARVRGQGGVALAEHFHYPCSRSLPRYAQDIAAAIVGDCKMIVRRDGCWLYDLKADPLEGAPVRSRIAEFSCLADRSDSSVAAVAEAVAHLESWKTMVAAA